QRDTAPLFGDFDTGGGESSIRYGSNNVALKWNAVFTPKFFMEAQLAHHDGFFRESSNNDEYNYTDLRNNFEFRRGATSASDGAGGTVPYTPSPMIPLQGGVGFLTQQDDINTQAIVKLTSTVDTHELKYGVEYDKIKYRENATYSGPSFNIELPVSFYDPA